METLKRYRLWAIVVSCCMIVLGAAMILRPDISALAVCYLTGALCIAMGVCEIARYFSIGVIGILFRFDLIVGILSTLAGVLLLAHPTGALTVLPIIWANVTEGIRGIDPKLLEMAQLFRLPRGKRLK